MITPSLQHLRQFIASNNLKREDGITVFRAIVVVNQLNEPIVFEAEIQIVTLPSELVLYILECSIPAAPVKEMYRTHEYQFTFLPPAELEIKKTIMGEYLRLTPIPSSRSNL